MEPLGPHELAYVFAQLTDPADMARARAVCREWRDIMDPPHINGKQITDVLRLSPSRILKKACRVGSLDLAKYAISRGATDFNGCLYNACANGHKELAELMISRGATNFDWGLGGACKRGHKELVELMISRGATDFNVGLYYACYGGNKELANFMVSRGATDFNIGLYGACEGGCKEITKLLDNIPATGCYYCGKRAAEHA